MFIDSLRVLWGVFNSDLWKDYKDLFLDFLKVDVGFKNWKICVGMCVFVGYLVGFIYLYLLCVVFCKKRGNGNSVFWFFSL